jgi:hypothetical protein
MVMKISAFVYADNTRRNQATIIIVFPRSTLNLEEEDKNMGEENVDEF